MACGSTITWLPGAISSRARSERGLRGVERLHIKTAHQFIRQRRYQGHPGAGLDGREGGGLVPAEYELILDALQYILGGCGGQHPFLESLVANPLAAFGHQDQCAPRAHEVTGIFQPLVRLVQVDIFGIAARAGDDDIASARHDNFTAHRSVCSRRGGRRSYPPPLRPGCDARDLKRH